MKPRRPQHRHPLALIAAVCAHLLAFLALGWRIPVVQPPPSPRDALPPMEVQLLRPPQSAPPTASATAKANSAKPSPAQPIQARPALPNTGASLTPLTAPAPPSPQVAQGPPDCAPEDLPLLTEAEKARCRNQVEADKERSLARSADERAARQVAEAERGPQAYRMASEKQAYYDAVAAAYTSPGHLPKAVCGLPGSHIKKPHNGLKLGPCVVIPPQGTLTEEMALDPLDPQWLPKP